MAQLDIGSLMMRIEADGDGLFETLNKAQSAIDKSVQAMTNAGSAMTKAVTVPMTGLAAAAVKSASDLEETISKTGVVFDELSDKVMAWSETSIEAMGLAQGTALDMASTFGDMGTGMGLTLSAATDMSMQLTQLSADLASFKNIGIDRVQQALTGVYTGETEALKSLGVVMTQTNLQAFALSQGITKQISAMTQAEQVQLRYQYVMAQTANAQGDFARTGDSFANQTRKLTQTVKQIGESFGTLLLPSITSVVGKLAEGAQWIAELDDDTKSMVLSVGTAAAAMGPLLLAGAKMLKLITSIKLALAGFGMTVSPLLAVAGVLATAIGVGVYSALNKASDAIDTTGEKYQKLKAIVSGTTLNFKTDLDQIDGSTVTVNLDADGTQALEKAQDILDELDSDKYAGVLTIDGDSQKAQEALDALETAVQNLLGGTGSIAELQAAVDACEELVISPSVDEETRSIVQGKLDELRKTLDGLSDANITFSVKQDDDSDQAAWDDFVARVEELGWESKTFTASGKFEVDPGTTEAINAYAEAMSAAATATGEYDEAVNSLNSLIDQQLKEQTQQIDQEVAARAKEQAALLGAGIIDEEQYNAAIKTILEGAEAAKRALESEAEAAKTANDVLADGVRENDFQYYADYAKEAFSGEGISTEMFTGAVAALTEAKNASEDLTNYQVEAKIAMAGLQQQAEQSYAAMTAAQEEYDMAMSSAEGLQDQADSAQTAADKYQLLADTLSAMPATFANGPGGIEEGLENIATSMTDTEEQAAELKQMLMDVFSDESGNLNLLTFEEQNDAITAAMQLQQEEAARAAELQEQANSARESAAQSLTESMQAIQQDTSFTSAQLNELLTLVSDTGVTMDEESVKMIAGVTGLVEGVVTTLQDGGPDVADAASEMIGSVNSVTNQAASSGASVGAAITSGITSGLSSGTDKLYAAVRRIVNRAIREAQAAADAHSPSRKSKKLVGLPLIQGIGAGVEEGTEDALKIMRRSTEKLLSGAEKVVSNGGYTAPAVQLPGTSVDYDRMGEAMTDAVSSMNMVFRVSDKELARATRESNARQTAQRNHEINMGKGRVQ